MIVVVFHSTPPCDESSVDDMHSRPRAGAVEGGAMYGFGTCLKMPTLDAAFQVTRAAGGRGRQGLIWGCEVGGVQFANTIFSRPQMAPPETPIRTTAVMTGT